MSNLRYSIDDVRQLAEIDTDISTILLQMAGMVDKTVQGLDGILQHLRDADVMSQEVTGPMLLLERSFLDRHQHLEETLNSLLRRRAAIIRAQIERGGASDLWAAQLALPQHLGQVPFPSLMKTPGIAENRRISHTQALGLVQELSASYQAVGLALLRMRGVWQSEVPVWASLIDAATQSEVNGVARFEDAEAEKKEVYEQAPPPPEPEPANGEIDDVTSPPPPVPPPQPRPSGPASAIGRDTVTAAPIAEPEKPAETPRQWQSAEPPDHEDAFGGRPLPPPPPLPPQAPRPAWPMPTPAAPPGEPMPDPHEPDRKSSKDSNPPVFEPTRFSAFAPKEIPPAQWVSFSAYIFRESAADKVQDDAKLKFGAALAEMRHSLAPALVALPEGVTITATPRLDGFMFNPESLSLRFVKAWHRFDFEMMAGREMLNLASNGAISFSMAGILVGEIPLSVFVGENCKPALNVVEASAYQKIFCSYSHRDTNVVERVERVYRVLGFDYLRDATHLRSGQEWNKELLRMIDEANIFQLFWSAAAAESRYVEEEWRHALSHERPQFVRPVYWKKPMFPPPPELEKLHFAFDADIQGAGWWQWVTGRLRGGER